MSVAATNWVWTQSKAEGADRLVLLALADFADETGKCFGSWGTMQRKTRLARCTIARSIKRLEAAGELAELEPAKTVNGRNMATVWQLPVGRCQDETGLIVTLPPSHSDITPGLNVTLPRCQNETPTIVNVKETRSNVEGAAAPAPATASPSLPIPKQSSSRRKKEAVSIDDLSLPHGAKFRSWWERFMEHRAQPIKGRRSPLTKLAADLILEDLAQITEANAISAIREAITSAWVKPYTDKYQQAKPVVNQDAAERRRRKMLEEELAMKAAFAAAKEAA